MEYKNLNIGKQADSLFEIPSGYKNLSSAIPALPAGLDKLDKKDLEDLLKQEN
jgi:hypothetical protein